MNTGPVQSVGTESALKIERAQARSKEKKLKDEELPRGDQLTKLAVRASQAKAEHEVLARQTALAQRKAVNAQRALTAAVHEETGLTGVPLVERVHGILQEAQRG